MKLEIKNKFLRILFGFMCGLLLTISVESELISTQIAIFITFAGNMLVSYNVALSHLKIHFRNIIASFLLGALLGMALK